MILEALAIERAAATRTAERVLHYHIAQYHVPTRLSATGWHPATSHSAIASSCAGDPRLCVRPSYSMKIRNLHIMEPNAGDLATGTTQITHPTEALRPRIHGAIITNGGYDKAKAQTALTTGIAEMDLIRRAVSSPIPIFRSAIAVPLPSTRPTPRRSTGKAHMATRTIRHLPVKGCCTMR
jgi:hypothetical protein